MDKITEENKEDLVCFTNIDNEDFVGKWAGREYVIRAGEVQTFFRYLTYHFAKHLINKMALKASPDGSMIGLPPYREELESKIIGGKVDKPIEEEKSEGEAVAEKVEELQDKLESRKEEIRAKRAEILKKAREAKAAKATKKVK